MNTRKLLLTISLLANASFSFAMESVSAKASDFAKARADRTLDKEKEEKPYESKKRMCSNSQENEISAFTSPQPMKRQKTQYQIQEEIRQAERKREAERQQTAQIEERVRLKRPRSLRVSDKKPASFQHAGKRPFKRRKAEMQPAFYYMETNNKLVDTTESAEDIEDNYQLFNLKDDAEKAYKEAIESELRPFFPEFRRFLPVSPDLEELPGQSVVEKETSPQSRNQKRRLTIRLGEKIIESSEEKQSGIAITLEPMKPFLGHKPILTVKEVVKRLKGTLNEEEKKSLFLEFLNKNGCVYGCVFSLLSEINLKNKKLLLAQIAKMEKNATTLELLDKLLEYTCEADKITSRAALVEQLLTIGANPVFKNNNLQTLGPLDYAFRIPPQRQREVVINLLLNKAKEKKKTIESNSILRAAIIRRSEDIETQLNRCKEIIITRKLKPNLEKLNSVIPQGRSWKIKSLITQHAQWNNKKTLEKFILKNKPKNDNDSNGLLAFASLLPRLIEKQLNSQDANGNAFLSSKQIVRTLAIMQRQILDKNIQADIVARLDISLDKVMRLFTHKYFRVYAMPQLLRFKEYIISACTVHKIIEKEQAEEQFNAFHYAVLKLSEQDEINKENSIIKRIDMLPNNNIFKLLFVTNNPDLYNHKMKLI